MFALLITVALAATPAACLIWIGGYLVAGRVSGGNWCREFHAGIRRGEVSSMSASV